MSCIVPWRIKGTYIATIWLGDEITLTIGVWTTDFKRANTVVIMVDKTRFGHQQNTNESLKKKME